MLRMLTAAALALTIVACSDDDPEPAPSDYYLQLTFAPAAVTVAKGGNATVNLFVTRGGLYPGTVTLAVEGLPANVTGTFVPATLPAGVSNSILTISAGAQAAAGSCAFTIRASGPDVDDAVTPAISCVVTP